MRYAERFADGLGLTWTDGERVEGYTDLLWILLLSAGHFVGANTIWFARCAGIVGAIAAFIGVCLPWKVGQGGLRPSLLRALSGGAFFVLLEPMAVWALGGLEHGFMTGVLVWAIWWQLRGMDLPDRERRRPLLYAGLLFSALTLLRADGILFAAIASTLCLLHSLRKAPFISTLAIGLPSALAWLGQLGFRLSYYNEWVPNTAKVKVSFNLHRLEVGIRHFDHASTGLLVYFGVACAALLILFVEARRGRCRHQAWTLPLALFAGWEIYLASVGGDIFPAWRQLLLGLPPLAILIANAGQLYRRAVPRLLPIAALFGLAIWHASLQRADKENHRGKTERWEWAGLPVGTLLRQAFNNTRPLLAVDAAGALPYWSQLPALDMLGLNDAYLAQHPPAHFGRGAIGHELGDGDYVMRRAPDIIAFNNAAGSFRPLFLGGKQLLARPDFLQRYAKVRVLGTHGSRAVGELYLRKHAAMGWSKRGRELDIAGFFFHAGTPGATLDGQGKLSVTLDANQTATLDNVELPRGRFLVEAIADGPVRVGFRCGGRNANPLARQGNILELTTKMPVAINITTEKRTVLRRVRFQPSAKAASARCTPSGGALRTSYQNLRQRPVKAGSPWNHGDHLVFDGAGLHISMGKMQHASQVELSGDNNDTYTLHFLRQGQPVGTLSALPGSRPGMFTRRLTLPLSIQELGFDEVQIIPAQGDSSYSLGHLRFTK